MDWANLLVAANYSFLFFYYYSLTFFSSLSFFSLSSFSFSLSFSFSFSFSSSSPSFFLISYNFDEANSNLNPIVSATGTLLAVRSQT